MSELGFYKASCAYLSWSFKVMEYVPELKPELCLSTFVFFSATAYAAASMVSLTPLLYATLCISLPSALFASPLYFFILLFSAAFTHASAWLFDIAAK